MSHIEMDERGIAPYRQSVPVLIVDEPPRVYRPSLWARFWMWLRGLDWSVRLEQYGSGVIVSVVTPGANPNIDRRMSWKMLLELSDILEVAPNDGSPVVFLMKNCDPDVQVFPGPCVPKLRRAICEMARSYRLATEVQK